MSTVGCVAEIRDGEGACHVVSASSYLHVINDLMVDRHLALDHIIQVLIHLTQPLLQAYTAKSL